MGAMEFRSDASGKTAKEAFDKAVDAAGWEHGHGGYSGTIAEKRTFRMVTPRHGETPADCMERCLSDPHHFCQDKWGPAACIDRGDGAFLFFGWASS